jgi:hypothetical protein
MTKVPALVLSALVVCLLVQGFVHGYRNGREQRLSIGARSEKWQGGTSAAAQPSRLQGKPVQSPARRRATTPINLALDGIATQSSTYGDADASRAIDGNTDGDWSKRSVSHTRGEPGEWWQLHLKRRARVTKVIIFNRTDAVGDRLRNFRVLLRDGKKDVFSRDIVGPVGRIEEIELPANITSDFVRIQMNGAEFLHMAEVQVWGRPR